MGRSSRMVTGPKAEPSTPIGRMSAEMATAEPRRGLPTRLESRRQSGLSNPTRVHLRRDFGPAPPETLSRPNSFGPTLEVEGLAAWDDPSGVPQLRTLML